MSVERPKSEEERKEIEESTKKGESEVSLTEEYRTRADELSERGFYKTSTSLGAEDQESRKDFEQKARELGAEIEFLPLRNEVTNEFRKDWFEVWLKLPPGKNPLEMPF